MTVGELIKKLQKMPKSATVYMVTDRGYDNYDEDGRYKLVHPIEYVTREDVYTEDFEGGDETNVLLEIEEP